MGSLGQACWLAWALEKCVNQSSSHFSFDTLRRERQLGELMGLVTQASCPKIQQTKMLVTCQRFGDLFLFGLVWQYSSIQTKYNKGRFKVMATYLQQ